MLKNVDGPLPDERIGLRSVEGWGEKKRWQFGRRPEQGEGHAEDDEGRRKDETGEEELCVPNGVLEPLEQQRVDLKPVHTATKKDPTRTNSFILYPFIKIIFFKAILALNTKQHYS